MTATVLGLGSNRSFVRSDSVLLSSHDILHAAFADVSRLLSEPRFSAVYRTRAMYVTDQPDFYNAAVWGWYAGSAQDLLDDIHLIELKYGRNRDLELRNGPRSLDIDIELFGDQVITTPDLVIPHERLKERAFVLYPLLDVCPESADPVTGMKFKTFLEKLPDQNVVRIQG